MSTGITTTPIPIDDSDKKTIGDLVHSPIITNSGNHHCFQWTIQNIDRNVSERVYLKSPIFTVPNNNECKWYLSIQSMFDGNEKKFIFSSLHLVLDRTSDCKEAVAKFKLSILDPFVATHECNLQPSRTFKFATNFENNAGILSSICQEYFKKNSKYYYVTKYPSTIVCEIMIETTFCEDRCLSNDFGYLLKNQLFTDTVILVGEKKYPVHKVILASRSSVFAAMFAHDTIEKEGVVQIEGMNEDVVEEMLHYIYTGKVEKLENLARIC
ncbi:hypothetical protein U1Q18_042339 [Sarracenia purpurea var. burkii]